MKSPLSVIIFPNYTSQIHVLFFHILPKIQRNAAVPPKLFLPVILPYYRLGPMDPRGSRETPIGCLLSKGRYKLRWQTFLIYFDFVSVVSIL